MMRAPENLEKRLTHFLVSRIGAEAIDALSMTTDQQRAEKADFFLENRSVICELKSIKSDISGKVDALVQDLLKSPHAPAFYGQWELEKILAHFPNREELRRKLFERITTAIEDLFEKANRQIRTTKTSFSLPSSSGALILANDFLDIHTPETLAHRVSQLMTKKTQDGAIRYLHIEAVWIISETHFVEIADGVKGLPAIIVQRDSGSHAYNAICSLQTEWARFNGVPLLQMDPKIMATVDFKKTTSSESSRPRVRFQLMQKEYELNPYLRWLDDDELGIYYQKLITLHGVCFFEGCPS